jgi:lysozyme
LTGRHINEAGLKLLVASEGCRLTAYPDPGTGGAPWTIGFGATGPEIKEGVTWTQDQCNKRLLQDLARFEKGVDELVKYPVSSNQFSACVVFAYNVGLQAFAKSTMLRLMNQGDLAGAAKQFGLWTRAAGRTMPGLVVRRQAELNLFRKPDRG